LAYAVGARGGRFVDFPTQAGAFFQWGMNVNKTYAYHPTKPVGTPSGWSNDYYGNGVIGYWNDIQAAQETCPSGWRRPNDGATNTAQLGTGSTSDYTVNIIYKSEMRQSLYAAPGNGAGTTGSGWAWGYYADGYFDRRPIGISVGTNAVANTAVSVNTKDAAYIGTLFFNSANGNRSLFAPAAGIRNPEANYVLSYSGDTGRYWSSSAQTNNNAWDLYCRSSDVRQYNYGTRGCGFSVRCVQE
jgi:hypothetical protein